MVSKSSLNTVIEIFIIEFIFGMTWYFMYSKFLINHIILFSDLALPDMNSWVISQFFQRKSKLFCNAVHFHISV